MSTLFSQPGSDTLGPGACYVRVAVERGVDTGGGRPDGGAGLTYRADAPVPVGRRVEVPLGRGDKLSAGIVIAAGGAELLDGLSPARVKPIARDTGAGLPPSLVELARWMAGYYVCPLGMVLTAMLPAAVKHRTGLRKTVELARAEAEVEAKILAETKLPPSAKKAWAEIEALGAGGWPVEPEALAARLAHPTLGAINRLVKLGLLVKVERDDVRATGGAPTQGMIEQLDPGAEPRRPRPDLTDEQREVEAGIGAGLGRFGVHLLRGVTGSGKTEVYLRLIERVLEAGKTALVLVPEISLTPQTAGRFNERFGPRTVAVMHSGLSASQRHREWTRASAGPEVGGARVVVGARSAVFAPLPGLGLIVVDEEHASDYKQDQLPRYHGRDVAIKRGQMEACAVVLGSATPSLESWANAVGLDGAGAEGREPRASGSGKYTLWELTRRATGGRLPPVEIVDLRQEQKALGRRGPGSELGVVGPTLEAALRSTLAEGGQAILLLNRRGYAGYIACTQPGCGLPLTCEHCDANLVHHKWLAGGEGGRGGRQFVPGKATVRCHHCHTQTLLPSACPACGSAMGVFSPGTQKLEEELAARLAGAAPGEPGSWIARVDGDTMGSAKEYFDLLGRFASGEVRVLLGTQMIAKGLDFPNVRLVGVLNADTALSIPDFRCEERTFQLISQVAGRAGRGSLPGRVIVQTFNPEARAIRLAADHDYRSFAAGELAGRVEAGLPPAARMARLVVRDADLPKAEATAATIVAVIREELDARGVPDAVRIDGPMPCPIARVAGMHRIAIELTAAAEGGRGLLQAVLAAARRRGLVKSDARIAVDIDPIALM
jgi:primosomal protein N' (replication factor Y) (superfamily II helicase)